MNCIAYRINNRFVAFRFIIDNCVFDYTDIKSSDKLKKPYQAVIVDVPNREVLQMRLMETPLGTGIVQIQSKDAYEKFWRLSRRFKYFTTTKLYRYSPERSGNNLLSPNVPIRIGGIFGDGSAFVRNEATYIMAEISLDDIKPY